MPELSLQVDRQNIEDQLMSIPDEMLVWSREAADRIQAAQQAKADFKVVEAKMSLTIRQNPVDYGFAKITEELAKSLVLVQPEVIAAQNAVIEAEHEANVARGIVDALEIKRSSLKYLAELTVSGFLGSTTVKPKGVRNDQN